MAQSYVAPRTAAEELLADIWADVLGLERVGIHDASSSSAATRCWPRRWCRASARRSASSCRSATLFEAPTVAELAQAVAEAQAACATVVPSLVARQRPDVLPLSFAQERLWFLDQLEPGSATYNMPAALRIRGRLDVEALRRSIETIVERHEVLRTTFVSEGGEPVQKIHAPAVWLLPCIDLAEASLEARALARGGAAVRSGRWAALAHDAARASAEDDHVLLVTMHHIVSDGWSIGVLVREMRALYPAFAAGQSPALAPLPVQYADFALWQRSWLSGEALEQQVAYWREQLAGAPALELPTDRPRPAVASQRRRDALVRAAGGADGRSASWGGSTARRCS